MSATKMVGMTNQVTVSAGGAGRPAERPSQSTVDSRAWWGPGLAVAAVGWGAQQFTPLLLLYRAQLGLSPTVLQGTFGVYALGLIPGLLLGGPCSDRFGRRRVMIPTLAASLAGTVLLIPGGTAAVWLFAGRLVAGAASGAAFSSGAAWIKELSSAAAGPNANPGPRRLTVTMSVGFALGPLVAGALAQWAPAPTVLPYLPHLVFTAIALPLVMRAPETRSRGGAPRGRLMESGVRHRRFLGVVVPLAPWVFGSASIALAYLPTLVAAQLPGHVLIFSAVITLLTAGAGIVVQPLARRVDRPGTPRLIATSLGIVVAGLLVAVLVAAWAGTAAGPVLVVLAALVLGAGYGCCQVCGLLEVQRLARPEHLAGLTAIYQAVSYVGFVAPFPLAAASRVIPPATLLLAVAGFAALTLLWTTWRARR
jgi:MFS family permease